jgi:hypothetical protein
MNTPIKRLVASAVLAVTLGTATAGAEPAPTQKSPIQEGEKFASGEAWIVMKFSTSCSVVFIYERETELFVKYVAGTNSAFVTVVDPAFKSIKEDQKYPVELSFLKGKTLDDGWGTLDMVGLRLGGLPGIGITLSGRTLLTDLKQSDWIILTRDDGNIIVNSLSLKGSAVAVAKLEQCANQVQKENPADPFAG